MKVIKQQGYLDRGETIHLNFEIRQQHHSKQSYELQYWQEYNQTVLDLDCQFYIVSNFKYWSGKGEHDYRMELYYNSLMFVRRIFKGKFKKTTMLHFY